MIFYTNLLVPTDFEVEVEWLDNNQFSFPKNILHSSRYSTPYPTLYGLQVDMANCVLLPMANLTISCYYLFKTVLAALHAFCGLLVLDRSSVIRSSRNVGVNAALASYLAVLAPVNAIAYCVSQLTRIVASWRSFDSTKLADAISSRVPLKERYKTEIAAIEKNESVITKKYFTNARFFTPYKNVDNFTSAIQQHMSEPMDVAILAAKFSFKSLENALVCVGNLLIAQPELSAEAAHDFSVHFPLALALAVMLPISVILNEMTVLSRLGTTWHAAYTSEDIFSDVSACTL